MPTASNPIRGCLLATALSAATWALIVLTALYITGNL